MKRLIPFFFFYLYLALTFSPGQAQADNGLRSSGPDPGSPTPIFAPTNTRTPSPSPTPSQTPTSTPSQTPTRTPTSTPTRTPTVTATPTPTGTPTDSPTITPTSTPNPCSFAYGVTLTGGDQPETGNALESPLTLTHPVTVQDIHGYSSQAETLMAGVYNSSESLLESVTLHTNGAGWYSTAFPVTLAAGKYYLGRYGAGANANLVPGAGVTCYYDQSGDLPKIFNRMGSYPSCEAPVYLTACSPMTIVGTVFGLGDSTMYGEGLGGQTASRRFLTLFGDWLNANYGPVTVMNEGLPMLVTCQLEDALRDHLAAGITIQICVLEVGQGDFEQKGSPQSSDCGGESLTDGLLSALVFGAQTQNAISQIKEHMAPGGTILIMNIYAFDDVMEAMYPKWKDYRDILAAYNDVLSLLAEANGAKLIDLYSLFEANSSYKQTLGVHASLSGHYAIAELLKKTIESEGQPGKETH